MRCPTRCEAARLSHIAAVSPAPGVHGVLPPHNAPGPNDVAVEFHRWKGVRREEGRVYRTPLCLSDKATVGSPAPSGAGLLIVGWWRRL